MSYCTITEVRGVNPKRTYDTTSTPTATEVEEFIDRIGAEIDVVLQGRGLTTPITSPTELVSYLEQLNALGAAAMAEQAMFPEAKGMATVSSSEILWKRYREGLEYIKHEDNLSSETGAQALPFSFFEQNMGADTEPSESYSWQDHKFKKNKEW